MKRGAPRLECPAELNWGVLRDPGSGVELLRSLDDGGGRTGEFGIRSDDGGGGHTSTMRERVGLWELSA